MDIDPGTLVITLAIASLAVIGLLLHYVTRVGRRYDMLCVNGLLGVSFGLLVASIGLGAARELPTTANLFSVISLSVALCFIAIALWWEGLRRFRDAR